MTDTNHSRSFTTWNRSAYPVLNAMLVPSTGEWVANFYTMEEYLLLTDEFTFNSGKTIYWHLPKMKCTKCAGTNHDATSSILRIKAPAPQSYITTDQPHQPNPPIQSPLAPTPLNQPNNQRPLLQPPLNYNPKAL
ncbi:hypothetical protein Pelo_19851 [Pelomyxa schiedti]|nr:hypothetical protein Pelo_19851 [Pelomyxa schiedti]